MLLLALLLTSCTALAAPAGNTADACGSEGDWPADATVDEVLDALTYSDATCDGIPQYYYTAADGTAYAFHFDETGGWVWRDGKEEATVDTETARFLKANAGTLRYEVGPTPAAAVGYTESERLLKGALNAEATAAEAGRVRLPLYRLDTKADADGFLTEFADQLQIDYELNGAYPSLRHLLASYDEGFYASKSLMLVYLTANSTSNRYGIHEVKVGESAFFLLAARTDHNEVGDAAMAGWVLLFEVADEDLAACNAYDAFLVMEE